jgi:dTDP-4-dehydrorhamnose 3,5-epimerase
MTSASFFRPAPSRQPEFSRAGLSPVVAQANLPTTAGPGRCADCTFQGRAATEAKLVRCTAGAVLDQVVDVREGSPTYLRSFAVELSAVNRTALYVPPMLAHGFQTLVDDTEVTYLMSESYRPGTGRGLRPDDPALGLSWPLPVSAVSDQDRGWPLLDVRA